MQLAKKTPRSTLAGTHTGHNSHDRSCNHQVQRERCDVKSDPLEAFRQVIEAQGLRPDEIEPDGMLHRCPDEGKPGQKDCAYILHLDHPASGWFQNFRTGVSSNWTAVESHRLSISEQRELRERIKADTAAKEEERARQYAQARDKAESYLAGLLPITELTPYLANKGVIPAGVLRVDGDTLVVPIFDENGRVQTLQYINADGSKRLYKGGRKKGGFFPIGESGKGPLFITTGVATGLSIYEATAADVVCAIDDGNLKPVGEIMRRKFPKRDIIIAGDNDQRTDGNPGRTKAEEVAKDINAKIVVPLFKDRPDLSDFNDLHQLYGIEEVVAQLNRADFFESESENEPFITFGIGSLTANPPQERLFVVDGLFPEGIVGVLAAPGGTGKSILLLTLSMHIAAGRTILGHSIARPRGVLVCSAEDDVEEVQRRTHAIRIAAEQSGEPFTDEDLNRVQVADLVGNTEEIVVMDGNNAVVNELAVDRIVEAANRIEDLALIILDPVARFRSGGENDSGAATCFVKALETIRKATGATVLVAHHSRKGSTGDSVDDIRGSSALVDACRWAATLSTLHPKTAKDKYGLDEIDRKHLVRFKVVKENYTAPTDEVWLKRESGGVLQATSAPIPAKEAKGRAEYEVFLQGLKGLIVETGGITHRKLRDNYVGVDGTFGIGRKKMDRFIQRGLDENSIRKNRDGNLEVTTK